MFQLQCDDGPAVAELEIEVIEALTERDDVTDELEAHAEALAVAEERCRILAAEVARQAVQIVALQDELEAEREARLRAEAEAAELRAKPGK